MKWLDVDALNKLRNIPEVYSFQGKYFDKFHPLVLIHHNFHYLAEKFPNPHFLEWVLK